MRLEHIAVTGNTEEDTDKFFIDLLGMEKTRSFTVSPDLIKQFFGVEKEQHIIRYESAEINAEIFITNDDDKVKDIFTHNCLLVKDPEDLLTKAKEMGFPTTKVPRTGGSGFYYFIQDLFGNLYEIKILE